VTPRFLFLGRLCLDFVFTGGAGERARWERLHEPSDLDDWLAACSLQVHGARATPADLTAARELREAIWEGAQALLAGAPPARQWVRTLNRAAAQPPLVPRLEAAGRAVAWQRPTARAALSSVARDAVAMLGDPAQRARVRECESADCRLVFYDDSRPGRRRWCTPERCGDRQRARAYRERQRRPAGAA
jgi:predicted RNA-binding Zn ribbon-like protein